MSQARFQKRQREKARQEKAAAKRERRAARAEEAATDDGSEQSDAPPESRVLAQLAALHEQFDNEELDFDEFEDRKRELLAQLDV